MPIVLQNSQNAVRSISRKLTKRAAIADRCRLKAIAEVACEFIADYVVPQMIILSPRARPGKFVFSDAKRLLQQYLPEAGLLVCWCRRYGRMDMGGERKTLQLPGRVGAIVAGRDQIFPNAARPDMAERLEKHLSHRFSNPSSTKHLELFR